MIKELHLAGAYAIPEIIECDYGRQFRQSFPTQFPFSEIDHNHRINMLHLDKKSLLELFSTANFTHVLEKAIIDK